MITVLLVDDHLLFCEMLTQRLGVEPDIRVVGTAGGGMQALDMAREHRPDVVLLDLEMPGMDGIEVLEAIHRDLPGTRVIMLTGSDDRARVLDSLRRGASGYLSKRQSVGDVVEAVRTAFGGEPVLGAAALRVLMEEVVRTPQRAPSPAPRHAEAAHVSPRERDVLAHLCHGRSNADIARLLVVSENTVKAHISNLLRKLGARDRLHLALMAREMGLPLPED